MQFQPPLLRVEKNPHQALGLFPENAGGNGADFAVHKQKAIHRFRRLAFGQPRAQRKFPRSGGQQGHALFQRARDEEDVAHVRVKVAHEFFDAFARRAVAIAQAERHGGLQIFAQRIHRAVGLIMQFRPRPQQKVIGGFELPALDFADELAAPPVRPASARGI